MTYVDARDDFNLSIVFTVDTRMANRVPAANWELIVNITVGAQ